MPLRNELQAVWDAYVNAYRRRDACACADLFAPNAVLVSPFGPAASGQKEIETLHAEWTLEGGENKMIEMIEFGGSDDLAWCLSKFSEGDAAGEGTSLNILERQPDGTWLIRMCSLNEGTPSAP